eukprot:1468907-Prorocentrum_lima.AAC.1
MLATALLLVIVVFVLCTDVGCVRGCTMLMFTEQWMNISDVSRGIEMRAFLFWPGALSPERSACIQIRSSACVRCGWTFKHCLGCGALFEGSGGVVFALGTGEVGAVVMAFRAVGSADSWLEQPPTVEEVMH